MRSAVSIMGSSAASMARGLGVNRAVGYLLGTRAWQSASYLVTALLITRRFSDATQGYYYTFLSLLALQVFVELGLAIVIINSASHEWTHLAVDGDFRITGDPDALSRLVSLGRIVIKWYAGAMILFVVGVGLGGWIFFSKNPNPGVDWKGPWVALVLLAGIALCLTPFNALLEGCNQVVNTNRVKFQQVVLEGVAVWSALVLGLGLWCLPLSVAVRLLRNLLFLFVEYRHFFGSFARAARGRTINWMVELWPMQWRLAIQGMVVFFVNSLVNPVMFRYHGAAVAGRTGMTLQMINGMQIIAMAWISTRVPTFGNLIAKRHFAELDRLWLRAAITSLGVLSAALVLFTVVLPILRRYNPSIAGRLLEPQTVVLFSIAALTTQMSQCFAAYLRAHRREPIMVASVTVSVTTGLLVWLWGKQWGPLGAGSAYVLPSLLGAVWLWLIWLRCRREWHAI